MQLYSALIRIFYVETVLPKIIPRPRDQPAIANRLSRRPYLCQSGNCSYAYCPCRRMDRFGCPATMPRHPKVATTCDEISCLAVLIAAASTLQPKLPACMGRADLKGVKGAAALPFYASFHCQFILQVTWRDLKHNLAENKAYCGRRASHGKHHVSAN